VTRARPTLPRALRALALASALAAAAAAFSAAWLLAAIAVALASPFAEWEPVPARRARMLRRAASLALAGTFAVVWVTRPLYGTSPGTWPALLCAPLAGLACAFALAPRAFPGGRSLAAAIVGVLALAGIDPSPAGFGPSHVAVFRAAGHGSFAETYLGLCVVVVLALWIAAVAETGPAWTRRRAVSQLAVLALGAALAAAGVLGLPAAQPLVERAVAARFDSAQTGLSDGSTLGEFASLSASSRRVVDVRAASGGEWLLRAERLTRFDGHRWSRARPSKVRRQALQAVPAPVDPPPLLRDLGSWFRPSDAPPDAPAHPAIPLRLNQRSVDSWPLLLPRDVLAVTADVPFLELDDGLYRRPLGVPVQVYGALVSCAPLPAPATLEAPSAESLELPALDARLRMLASTLAPADASPRARLAATLRQFASGYAYTLEPGAWGPDPVAQFVFEKRRGYCEYFASAAVVLLRLQGVPARFVKGLRVGRQNDYGGGLYVVRESDAHAWVEAWLPGEGWVEADPTPPGALDSLPKPDRFARLLEHLRAALAEGWARLTGPGLLAFLRWLGRAAASARADAARGAILLVALAAALAGPRLARRLLARRGRKRRRPLGHGDGVPEDLAAALDELERAWTSAGQPRPAWRGLREHALRDATSAGPRPLPSSAAAAALVDAYYRTRYGGQFPSAGEIERLRDALRS